MWRLFSILFFLDFFRFLNYARMFIWPQVTFFHFSKFFQNVLQEIRKNGNWTWKHVDAVFYKICSFFQIFLEFSRTLKYFLSLNENCGFFRNFWLLFVSIVCVTNFPLSPKIFKKLQFLKMYARNCNRNLSWNYTQNFTRKFTRNVCWNFTFSRNLFSKFSLTCYTKFY